MTAVEFAAAVLATWQAVEIWRHSTLFAGCRAVVECWLVRPEPTHPDLRGHWWSGLLRAGDVYYAARAKLAELLSCPWCLSVWVATLFAAWLLLGPPWSLIPLYGLAASRGANVLSDWTRATSRTPKGVSL